jgi:hypothetical protein
VHAHRCSASVVGWSGRSPVSDRPPSGRGHYLAVSVRDRLAGRAFGVRAWQTLWKRHRRYSGAGTGGSPPGNPADRCWRPRDDGLGCIGRLDDQPRPPTCDEPSVHYRGICRITRICASSLLHHAIGRSRGGLSTKIRALVDGKDRPLVLLTGPDQANDSPMFNHLRSQLRIDRAGPGRPRNRPERVRGDKAYFLARDPQSPA